MLDFVLSPAYAQAAAQQPSALMQFLPLGILVVLFYFMLIRPQMKRTREAKDMLSKLAKGDEVITAGGMAGRITEIGEVFVTLEVAANTAVKVQKSAISTVLPKGSLKAQ